MAKVLGILKGMLYGAVISVAAIGGGLFANKYLLNEKEDILSKIVPETQTVQLSDEFGPTEETEITIRTSKKDTNTINLEYYVKGYNDTNFTRDDEARRVTMGTPKIPINNNGTEVLVLCPKHAKISKLEQEVFMFPKAQWKSLVPLEKNLGAQLTFFVGEELVDYALSKAPGSKKALDEFIKYSEKVNAEKNSKTATNFQAGYQAFELPRYPSGLGTETARRYTITFEIDPEKGEFPVGIVTQIRLGTPEVGGNAQAKLDTIVLGIPKKEEMKKTEANEVSRSFRKYFFREDELRDIKLSPRGELEKFGLGNPSIVEGKKELAKIGGEEIQKLEKLYIANYLVPGRYSRDARFSQIVLEFENARALQEKLEQERDNSPKLEDGKVVVILEGYSPGEYGNGFNDEQEIRMIKMILDYEKRIGKRFEFGTDGKETQEVRELMEKVGNQYEIRKIGEN